MEPGIRSVRENWKPILLIQSCALIFAVLYYRVPALKGVTEFADSARKSLGIWFVLLSVWFASIVLPEIAKFITRQPAMKMRLKDVAFFLGYYGAIGLIVDGLYRWMGQAIGSDTSIRTVLTKIAIDMGPFCILVTMPMITLLYIWKDTDYSLRMTGQKLKDGEFKRRYFNVLATCWMYFGPFTVAMYNLPQQLIFPMSMAAQAGWSIIITVVASRKPVGAA
jgi:hypothetical protein